jgi:hypothetical protein
LWASTIAGPRATSPALQAYGERRAAVRNVFDNQWYLAAPAT